MTADAIRTAAGALADSPAWGALAPQGGAPPITYLLRDLFSTPASPAVSGAAEPTGTRTISGSGLSISGGELLMPNASGNSLYYTDKNNVAFDRVAGRAFRCRYRSPSLTGTAYHGLFRNTSAANRHIWQQSAHRLIVGEGTTPTLTVERDLRRYPGASVYTTIVLSAAGGRWFLTDQFGTHLLYFEETISLTPLRFGTPNAISAAYMADVAAWDTTIPTLSDTIMLDQSSPANDTNYSATNARNLMPGCAIVRVDITAPNPLSGSLTVYTRYVDADNYLSATFDSSGTITLVKRLLGTSITYTHASQFTAGQAIVLYVHMDDYNIEWRWHVAGAFKAARTETLAASYWDVFTSTAVRVSATDFAVSRIRAYPVMSSDYADINMAQTAKRFMPVGDSKTNLDSWVGQLADSITAIGSEQWVPIPGEIAAGGRTVATTLAAIDAALATRTHVSPTHVLINLGSNELGDPLPAEATWKADYRSLIGAIHAAYPGAAIYLAKPVRLLATPPSTPVASMGTLHAWIDDLVAEYSYVHAGINETSLQGADNYATNFVDYTHYTTAGQAAVAALWKTALGY